jgi:hypothetical protein
MAAPYVATKVTKKAVTRNTSMPLMAFALQISQNHGLQLFCPTLFALSYASAKTCYVPATARYCIVLPAFARSCSADGEERKVVCNQ